MMLLGRLAPGIRTGGPARFMKKTCATYDDVNLVIRLYELRREEKLLEARAWFASIESRKTK